MAKSIMHFLIQALCILCLALASSSLALASKKVFPQECEFVLTNGFLQVDGIVLSISNNTTTILENSGKTLQLKSMDGMLELTKSLDAHLEIVSMNTLLQKGDKVRFFCKLYDGVLTPKSVATLLEPSPLRKYLYQIDRQEVENRIRNFETLVKNKNYLAARIETAKLMQIGLTKMEEASLMPLIAKIPEIERPVLLSIENKFNQAYGVNFNQMTVEEFKRYSVALSNGEVKQMQNQNPSEPPYLEEVWRFEMFFHDLNLSEQFRAQFLAQIISLETDYFEHKPTLPKDLTKAEYFQESRLRMALIYLPTHCNHPEAVVSFMHLVERYLKLFAQNPKYWNQYKIDISRALWTFAKTISKTSKNPQWLAWQERVREEIH